MGENTVSASPESIGSPFWRPYFAGEKLYGNDFCPEEIEKWFRDEEMAYFRLDNREVAGYEYAYHALNKFHGFRHLPETKFKKVLGIGSAYGEEFRPVLGKVSSVTILEPAPGFRSGALDGIDVEYVKPMPTGFFPFSPNQFDLVTCLGVLHHIPNVGRVIAEISRCTSPGGYVLLREPVISMGDWRHPRPGLTARERGIPLSILRDMIRSSGFTVVREARCLFPITPRLHYVMKSAVFNSTACVLIDALICSLPWPDRYHATNVIQRLRPWGVYYVLRKSITGNYST